LDSSQIPSESLADAIEAFNALLKSVAHSVLGAGDKPHWNVKVQGGSAVLGYQIADKSITPSKANRMLKVIHGGLKSLAEGTDLPEDFPADAVRHLYDLGNVKLKARRQQSPIRIWFKKEPERLDENVIDNAQKFMNAYKEFGTVEGRIDTLQKRRNQFVIYEPIWDKFLEEARKHFGQRGCNRIDLGDPHPSDV
jgi:hypothetical protein